MSKSMDIADFLSILLGEDRRTGNVVARTELGRGVVDTCAVFDSDYPYETALCHPNYNGGGWIVVENYSSLEDARAGHARWAALAQQGLPETLVDVGAAGIAQMLRQDGPIEYSREEEQEQ